MTPDQKRFRSAPFTDGGGAVPATMAVDAGPRASDPVTVGVRGRYITANTGATIEGALAAPDVPAVVIRINTPGGPTRK